MHGLKIAGCESRVTTTRNTTVASLSRNVPGVYLLVNILILLKVEGLVVWGRHVYAWRESGVNKCSVASITFKG